MSTGPRKQAAFIQGNQSTIEHDTSHSALFFLFQEVSKLASPVHNSFLDTHPTSTWLHETSRPAPLIIKKEKEDGHLFNISNGSYQYSLSPYKQMKKVKEESHTSKVNTEVEPPPKCNSPWKVLSLINMQCERLLHEGDVASEPSLLSSTPKLGNSTDKSSTATADVTDQGVDGDCVSVKCTLRPSLFICEREEIPACHNLVEGMQGDCRARSYKPQCRVKDSCVQSQTAEKCSLLTIDRQCASNQQCQRVSSEQGILHAPFSEKFFPQTHAPFAFLDAQLTFNSNEDANVALSKPALDHNANLTLTAESPCDTHQLLNPVLPPRSASLLFGTAEKCQSLSKRDDKIASSEPECTHKCTNLSPSATSKTEQRPLQKEEIAFPSPQRWRTKTPRKQPHPRRSANIQDPNFQGVTFRIDTQLDDNREQCRLLITSNYSKALCKSVRKPRLRKRTSQKSSKTSSSDEDPTASVSKGKACASCCTRKTPMWRDAEDGTPLCNACGIRYKKYRVRCVKCWHIPRKEGNYNSCCLKCGNSLRLTSAQRKHNA